MLFSKFVNKNRNSFLFLVIMIIFSSFMMLPFPYISKIVVDNILLQKNYDLIFRVIVLFLLLVTVQMVIGRISAITIANFFQKFTNDNRRNVFNNFLESDQEDKNDSKGKLETVILSDIEMLSNVQQQIISGFFSNVILLLGYTCIIFLINWKLSIITILFLPIYIFWVNKVGNRIKEYSEENQKIKEQLYHSIETGISNLLVIQIYNFFERVRMIFSNKVEMSGEANKKLILYQNFINLVANIIVTAAQFVPLFVGGFLYMKNELSIGSLIAFNSYTSSFFGPLTTLISLLPLKKNADIFTQRIVELLETNDSKSNIIPTELNINGKEKKNLPLFVENMDIFVGEKHLLTVKDFTVEEGGIYRITGVNGSGKSLLLKSLCNIYKNYSGKSYIQGAKLIKDLSVTELSSQILYVSNDQGFIFENVYNELINIKTEQEQNTEIVEKALETVLMKDKNEKINFSSGEYQRLRIARALIKQPKVLILDEIFSNIDSTTTKKIFKNLSQNYPALGIVFVEHHFEFSELDYHLKRINKKCLL